jgi:bifunctional non-homologous end joining protein LigD
MTSKAAARDNRVTGVRITHPDRVVYPQQGLTKLALARYYEAAAERMLAYAADRPLSLVRCPQGRAGQCFFQKHPSEGFPEELRRVPIEEKDGKTEDYLYVTDAAGLVAAVQMGALEFHIWWSKVDKLERPDRLVFDLDPDEGLSFAIVRDAAFDVRDRLKQLGLQSLPMITGGKGVHVVVPLERRTDADDCRAFAEGFARMLGAEAPDRYTATMSKARRKGRIFLDWLRNQRGSTAIAPYSTRAREGAPVAMPVSWPELKRLKAANGFRIDEARQRLQVGDPWADAAEWRQSITKQMRTTVS